MGGRVDHGAHFCKCDLQVHSPRDRNWEGQSANTEEERKTFATSFVAACRQRGLGAVAITDHHDLAFFPYIREAANEERNPNGDPVAEKLIVFPGLELTLGLPCQAILIFDPDLNASRLTAAMHALGIEQAPETDPKSTDTKKLPLMSLQHVCSRIEALPSVKGRFILLPNVNDGGSDTLLRQDFAEHYKAMPCVGGYVDGNFEPHSRRNIVDGKDPAWGSKKVGVIQTSDARSADFQKLGASPTWIKWSSPTTEAIRQACLSPASRLRYSEPLTPDNWIMGMKVSASRFFGPFTVEFNPQTNMLIGGREVCPKTSGERSMRIQTLLPVLGYLTCSPQR